MAQKKKYNFEEKKRSSDGAVSLFLAILSVLLLSVSVAVSVFEEKAPDFAGGLAFCGSLFAFYGFYVGIRSLREKNISFALPITGSLLCGVLTVFWIVLFLSGIR